MGCPFYRELTRREGEGHKLAMRLRRPSDGAERDFTWNEMDQEEVERWLGNAEHQPTISIAYDQTDSNPLTPRE